MRLFERGGEERRVEGRGDKGMWEKNDKRGVTKILTRGKRIDYRYHNCVKAHALEG